MNSRSRLWSVGAAVLVAALAANFALAIVRGIGTPMRSDSLYFLNIARNVSSGYGYRDDGFWPGKPTMTRPPVWPLTVSAALKLVPAAPPDAVMRILALAINSLAAVAVAILAHRLFRQRMAALLAGVGYAIHPAALQYAYEGLSEPLFVLLAVWGVILILPGDEAGNSGLQRPRLSRFASGCLLLGLAVLVRANFSSWLGFAGAGLVALLLRRGLPALRQWVVPGAVGVVLFVAPALLWAARNYRVCGEFPVLSTIRGQTFYGGNNSIVANELEYWGYWVFPNAIPGEQPMSQLATRLSEREVDVYYYRKGKEYLRQHWSSVPRLWLGKIIRAYVPVPWKPILGSYAVSAFRLALYAASLAGLVLLWRRAGSLYLVVLAAMVASNLVTVLGFWGCARFAFILDPFLLPFAAAALRRSVCRANLCKA